MDMISYALGQKAGERNAQKDVKDVEIVSDMTFTDENNDGNITVERSGD